MTTIPIPPPAIAFSEDRKLIACSPYPVTWPQLKARFAINAAREEMAARFEEWIVACKAIVIVHEIWIGGSFCSEAVAPKDIDVVLFYRYLTHMPHAATRDAFLGQHAPILSNAGAKSNYGVDSATISLELPASQLVSSAARWAMILSNGHGDTKRAFYTVDCIDI